MPQNKPFSFDDGVTLKEYFEQKFEHVEKKFEQLEKERDQTQRALEKRLDGMNEIREALKDQAARVPSSKEMEQKMETLRTEFKGDLLLVAKDVRVLLDNLNQQKGMATAEDVRTARVAGYGGILIGVISLLLKIFWP